MLHKKKAGRNPPKVNIVLVYPDIILQIFQP